MNSFKDKFTISLPNSSLIFTRYLYIKDEARAALLISLLHKKDDAIFWAYELYYSGFQNELFDLLWQIYYDFYATLNPAFEPYFLKKHAEWLNTHTDTIVSAIVQDLLFRPFNTDIFFLRNIINTFQIDIEYHDDAQTIVTYQDLLKNMAHWIETSNYRSLAQWIEENAGTNWVPTEIYKCCLDIFESKGTKLTKSKLIKDFGANIQRQRQFHVCNKQLLLVSIMTLISKDAHLKKGRSIYFTVSQDDIAGFQTIENAPPYRILRDACIYNIDEYKWLSLFQLKRYNYNLKDRYWHHWEYHASFSPLWLSRIRECRGYVDYIEGRVKFIDDTHLEHFYDLHGLEPDEQSKEIQNRSIMSIESVKNWTDFHRSFNQNGLLTLDKDELDIFDTDKIIY